MRKAVAAGLLFALLAVFGIGAAPAVGDTELCNTGELQTELDNPLVDVVSVTGTC